MAASEIDRCVVRDFSIVVDRLVEGERVAERRWPKTAAPGRARPPSTLETCKIGMSVSHGCLQKWFTVEMTANVILNWRIVI